MEGRSELTSKKTKFNHFILVDESRIAIRELSYFMKMEPGVLYVYITESHIFGEWLNITLSKHDGKHYTKLLSLNCHSGEFTAYNSLSFSANTAPEISTTLSTLQKEEKIYCANTLKALMQKFQFSYWDFYYETIYSMREYMNKVNQSVKMEFNLEDNPQNIAIAINFSRYDTSWKRNPKIEQNILSKLNELRVLTERSHTAHELFNFLEELIPFYIFIKDYQAAHIILDEMNTLIVNNQTILTPEKKQEKIIKIHISKASIYVIDNEFSKAKEELNHLSPYIENKLISENEANQIIELQNYLDSQQYNPFRFFESSISSINQGAKGITNEISEGFSKLFS